MANMYYLTEEESIFSFIHCMSIKKSYNIEFLDYYIMYYYFNMISFI